MSPTEFELRAALQDGEGGGLDPDRIIARAAGILRERHARRVRIGSMSAAAAVVIGVAVSGSMLLHGSSGSTASSAAGRGDSAKQAESRPSAGNLPATSGPVAANASSAGGTEVGPVAPGPLHDAAAIACPDALPELAPGSAATGSLFTGTVEAIKVCVYTTATRQPVTSADGSTLNAIYTGAPATQIVSSIDDASIDAVPIGCPAGQTMLNQRSLVIIGVRTDGSATAPVVASLNPCSKVVSDGTDTRYDWTPPAAMAALVDAASQPGSSEPSPPTANGSPAR
jgi:hypothetical protein